MKQFTESIKPLERKPPRTTPTPASNCHRNTFRMHTQTMENELLRSGFDCSRGLNGIDAKMLRTKGPAKPS